MGIKNMEFLGINMTKNVQDLYPGNYDVLLREIKGDIIKWRAA